VCRYFSVAVWGAACRIMGCCFYVVFLEDILHSRPLATLCNVFVLGRDSKISESMSREATHRIIHVFALGIAIVALSFPHKNID
jgi:hypothetical protein